MKLKHAAIAAVPALLCAQHAGAVRQPDYLDERPVETAEGGPGRAGRTTTWDAPVAAAPAWRALVDALGPEWRAIWDADTAVPLRVFGPGIAAPGALASPDVAERAARRLLAERLDLLAPGARADDFVLAANEAHASPGGPMRTVAFWQTHKGRRVVDGAVSFLFKADRLVVIGSTAVPRVDAAVPARLVDPAVAARAATGWIADAYGAAPELLSIEDAVVLPIIRERDDGRGAIEHRTVVPVVVDLADPRGRWRVYVDAATGAPVARTQLLRFADGTIRYRVPVRRPNAETQDHAAMYAGVTVAGTQATTTLGGGVTWAGTAAAQVTTTVVGTYVRVDNRAGAEVTGALTLQPGGEVVWDHTGAERADAQLTGFVHTNLIKQFARTALNPGLAWLNQALLVAVNESGTCNAYSTGDSIHFYVQNNQCANTARLADVVYHEFGHSIHRQSIIPGAGAWEGALSEGVSDYLAATTTGDPAMGRGFFHTAAPLRHIDPPDREKVWPQDRTGRPHDDGEIIGGTLWDLRKALIAAKGEGPGKALADAIYYAINRRASDIPSTYVEALAADDDDGNLANGTPHKCLIDQAFGAHGLADGSTVTGATIAPPVLGADLVVTLDVAPPPDAVCPPPAVQGARATWRLRADPATTGAVELTGSGTTLTAQLPAVDDGQVVQYQVEVTFADGSAQTFPKNPADPWYEAWAGPVTRVWCTDFAADPATDGWTLGDGWQWGAPAGVNASDPAEAFAGANVIGTDLGLDGGDGDYEPNVTVTATSPVIAIPGTWDGVRLHYRRWLAVEDARYDHATISADGAEVWRNLQTGPGETHHRDREWRFHDVDLTAAAADGEVQLAFALRADQGLELGGWNVDELCVVAIGRGACGDGLLTAPEACDDGNTEDGDGCSATCTDEQPPGGGGDDDPGMVEGGCCSAGGGGLGGVAGPLALGALTLLGVGRRRRARAR